MYFCYVDDSGADQGRTLTGLLVPEEGWSDLLHHWLEGRRKLEREWGVPKNAELHAVHLVKGRGRPCATEEQNSRFTRAARIAAHDLMIRHLALCESVRVLTVAGATARIATVYRSFVLHLEAWALAQDTRVLIMFDGQSGPDEAEQIGQERAQEVWKQAIRGAKPYRDTHRSLPLYTRRVLEDPVMQDSRYSQFIQAADMVGYAAFHHLMLGRPEVWPQQKPLGPMSKAYRRLAGHWLPGHGADGIVWVDG
ncbi:DUF3800 domain-containing protein [Streptomyces albidoflavus]|uniref:DUF3800 domain-containing protein n=1 Tax=Streptomyces wadayamensis TaxID=141454 RepID=A0ABR4S8F3_9ACTN|nr:MULTISPECIES: DUF3800 domain-containing protein [Streptomyces]MYX52451.1 DUF3800 domain-containing protein [Streptomyces sp. SID8385]MYX85997.1 DUF3800 domain-containing protein [Streptomyces sp. SID4915]KDR61510.1 hypothetical protein DC60_13735 [Streptomyces wadayamensis]KUL68249.1 hypothetical protein ADL32_00370 [Streptomyces albidoflavus]MBT2876897.1 DUF3800 domain-containing protein [Streptomyces sp. McG6]